MARRRSSRNLVLALVGVVSFGGSDAAAQAVGPDDSFELSLMYGTNHDRVLLSEGFASGLVLAGFRDVRIDREPSHQRIFGIAVGGAVSRFVILFSEFLYNDLGAAQLSGRVGFGPRGTVNLHPRLFEWTGGAHAQFPTGSWRVRPYFGGGAGMVRARLRAEGFDVESIGNATDFLYHVDFGIRVFITRRIGVAPQIRLVRIPDEKFVRALVAAVFRFG